MEHPKHIQDIMDTPNCEDKMRKLVYEGHITITSLFDSYMKDLRRIL